MKTGLLQRIKNPIFLLAVASFIYQILVTFHVPITIAHYQDVVDIVSYVLTGVGIYHTFGFTPPSKPSTPPSAPTK